MVATGKVSSYVVALSDRRTSLPGLGAMAEVETIVDKVKEVLFQHGGVRQG